MTGPVRVRVRTRASPLIESKLLFVESKFRTVEFWFLRSAESHRGSTRTNWNHQTNMNLITFFIFVDRIRRSWSELLDATASHVVHSLRRLRTLCHATATTAVVRSGRFRYCSNSYGHDHRNSCHRLQICKMSRRYSFVLIFYKLISIYNRWSDFPTYYKLIIINDDSIVYRWSLNHDMKITIET